jgi:hypothetical protein
VRDVRALEPGKVVYDTEVTGFAARRQHDLIAYVLHDRTTAGRQRWHTTAGLEAL